MTQVGPLFAQLPTVVIWLVATILALRNLRGRPREGWTILALVGLALFMRFGLPVLASHLNTLLRHQSSGGNVGHELDWFLSGYLNAHSLLYAVHWSAILWLVFGRPTKSPGRYLEEKPAS